MSLMINRSLQRGFTLIEMMVAFLILAVGMLGVMSLQKTSISNSQNMQYRMQATQLAQNLMDSMRANQDGLLGGNYDGTAAARNDSCLDIDNDGCTAGEMAGHDIYEWQQELAKSLPSGEGFICLDDTPNDGTSATSPSCDGGSLYAIKIWWYEGETSAPSGTPTTADLLYRDNNTNGPSLVVSMAP